MRWYRDKKEKNNIYIVKNKNKLMQVRGRDKMRSSYPKYKVEFKINKIGYKDAKTNFTICEGNIT